MKTKETAPALVELPATNQPVINEFKGNRVLCLNPNSKYPFSFGIGKAQLILDNIKEIENFVQRFQPQTERTIYNEEPL
jgi:hypothetical protein